MKSLDIWFIMSHVGFVQHLWVFAETVNATDNGRLMGPVVISPLAYPLMVKS
jgi:hypothetical protein